MLEFLRVLEEMVAESTEEIRYRDNEDYSCTTDIINPDKMLRSIRNGIKKLEEAAQEDGRFSDEDNPNSD